jgi:adenylate cyclase class 2
MADDRLEIEVKFFLTDLTRMRSVLLGMGGQLIKPRIFERNIRYDTAWDSLMHQGKLLRLRQDSATRLTFKGEPEQPIDSEVRIREELEIVIDNFDTAAAILEKIGFEPRQIYEKYRETFHFRSVEVVLDEMPFGDFIELEGEALAIREVADSLDLDWNNRILENYLALMTRVKDHHDLPFEDLTFANFSNYDISIADILE